MQENKEVVKRNKILKELHIGIPALSRYTKILYPEGKNQTGYTRADLEKIREMVYNNREEKVKVREETKKIDVGFEQCGENEFYAKIIKENKIFSAGVFSSTNLNEDIKRFNHRGMKIIVIEEAEYKKILSEICKTEII